MNRDETIEAIKVMQHFADGGEVDCGMIDDARRGRSPTGPTWNWLAATYYIKPKPVECWVVVDREGDAVYTSYYEDNAEQQLAHYMQFGKFAPYRVVHLTEATP